MTFLPHYLTGLPLGPGFGWIPAFHHEVGAVSTTLLVGEAHAPLRIQATRTGTGQAVTRTVNGGLGPSIIDLPVPGCWSLGLTWGNHHDHLQLRYASG